MKSLDTAKSADSNKSTLLVIPAEALGFALELIRKDCPGAEVKVIPIKQ